MPAVAAIAPVPPATAGSAKPAPDAGKFPPFYLKLGGAPQEGDQAAAAVGSAQPAATNVAKPSSGKPVDKPAAASGAADGGPPAWLMAMLGGAAPVQAATASASQPEAVADDGMPAVATASAGGAAAAKPDAKAAGVVTATVQPLRAAAGPAVATAPPSADAKDADTDDAAAADDDPGVTLPVATATHETVAAHAAPADAPPVTTSAHTQSLAVADAAASLQTFARALDAAGSAAGTPVSAPATPHAVLNTEHAEWPQALADQVQWQLGREVQEARLELHPRDLGAVQVQVRITSDGAEVRFAATHPQAREALQAALPQLRSLLQGDGIALAQSQVGAQSSWQAPAQQQRQPQAGQGAGVTAAADEEPDAPVRRVVRIGLVDDFA